MGVNKQLIAISANKIAEMVTRRTPPVLTPLSPRGYATEQCVILYTCVHFTIYFITVLTPDLYQRISNILSAFLIKITIEIMKWPHKNRYNL